MKKSLSTIYSRYQTFVFAIILAIIAVSFFSVRQEEKERLEKENEMNVTAASQLITSSMDKVQTDLLEVLSSTASEYGGLWSSEFKEKFFDKQKMNQYLRNLGGTHDELEMLFLYRPDDYILFQGGEIIDIEDRNVLKKYIQENADMLYEGGMAGKWKVVPLETDSAIVVCYYYADADIYLGAAFRPSTIFKQLNGLSEDAFSYTVTDINGMSYTYYSGTAAENTQKKNYDLTDSVLGHSLQLCVSFDMSELSYLNSSMYTLLLLVFLIGFASIVLLQAFMKKNMVLPVQQLSEDVEKAAEMMENMQEVPQTTILPESSGLKNEVREITSLRSFISRMLNETVLGRFQLYQSEIQRKELQLVRYRAQLHPHFYLNAIMTIEAMTYQNREEDIRRYLGFLSNHIRYIIRMDQMTLLGEELDHLDNYFSMQDIRYPNAAMIFIDCTEELGKIEIPSLILLTIAENAFKYTLGSAEGMQFIVSCSHVREDDFCGVEIILEDNGRGFTEEQIAYYNDPDKIEEIRDGHVGLSNVRSTLALIYERNDLFEISQAFPNGAKVRIRIPDSNQ